MILVWTLIALRLHCGRKYLLSNLTLVCFISIVYLCFKYDRVTYVYVLSIISLSLNNILHDLDPTVPDREYSGRSDKVYALSVVSFLSGSAS